MPDREKVIAALEKACRDSVELPPFVGCIEITKEAVEEWILPLLREQEPAAANWEDQTDLDDIYLSWRCSRCGHYSPTETRYAYCPYCGAKMEVSGDVDA